MKIQKLTAIFGVLLAICFISSVNRGQAQDYIQCGSENSASAIVIVPAGRYDVYAKSGDATVQSETATLSTQKLEAIERLGACNVIGKNNINATSYTKIVSNLVSDGLTSIFYLDSASTSSMQSAAAPQVVFVDQAAPPCQLSIECSVTYQEQTMTLSPQKISLTSDSLKVGHLFAADPAKQQKVIYSVDGKPVYESKTLEPFNIRYVSGGEHTLVRRVIFSSGVSVSDSQKIERGTTADIMYVFQALFFSQSNIIRIVGIIVGLLIIWLLIIAIAKAINKRKIWKRTHVAVSSTYTLDKTKVGAQATFYDETIPMTLYRYRKLLIGLLVIAFGLLVTTTYIVGVFTVDGVSMFPTLQDKSVHPLIKVQKTLSQINRSEYVPKRGTIVVVKKDENNLFDAQAALEKHYVVKRVVGLPGERITIKNGKIMVFNKEHNDGFEPDAEFKWTSMLAGSEQFNIDITLKDSELFVVGDHRDESIDSRFYGPIDTKEVVGKVIP